MVSSDKTDFQDLKQMVIILAFNVHTYFLRRALLIIKIWVDTLPFVKLIAVLKREKIISIDVIRGLKDIEQMALDAERKTGGEGMCALKLSRVFVYT